MKPSELKAVLDQHRLWLESGGKQGKRADLEGVNLEGVNLVGANLVGAYLVDAYLADANLHGAILRGVNLNGANLRFATFDLNFKQVRWFGSATFSQDQIPWVCLHPRYLEWADSLKWVKAEKLSA